MLQLAEPYLPFSSLYLFSTVSVVYFGFVTEFSILFRSYTYVSFCLYSGRPFCLFEHLYLKDYLGSGYQICNRYV